MSDDSPPPAPVAVPPPDPTLFAGRFIVLDGPDGSGKSTQMLRLADWLGQTDLRVVVAREPGGTFYGERIREVLLAHAPDDRALTPHAEMLLFAAARAQLVHEVIRPARQDPQAVLLCDRFVSSTLAYQGAAGGVPVLDILALSRGHIPSWCWPDVTVLLDLPLAAAQARRRRATDAIESRGEAFHKAVYAGYLEQYRTNGYDPGDPAQRYLLVDATRDPDAVFADVAAVLTKHLAALPRR